MNSTVSKIECADRDQWLHLRQRDVTASVVGALFQCHPFTSTFDLYHEKRGTLSSRKAETDAMLRGTLLEPVAVELIRRARPEWKLTYSAVSLIYYRDSAIRLGATPDVLVDCPVRGPGVVQIKTMTAGDFATKWVNEDGQQDAPLWINLQAETERHLTGRGWAAVAAMTIDTRANLGIEIIDVPAIDGIVTTIENECLAFWDRVANDDEPTPDYASDGETIRNLYPVHDPDSAVDLTDAADFEHLVARAATLRRARREADAELNEITAEIMHRMGGAEVGYLSGGRAITWRRERTSGRFIAPSDGRRLILPKPMGAWVDA
ncbi:Phage-related protein, predicted endonuclease [Loktanella atrilutea]|uniref:Phage-related protein, predicted endonuclease n=1 Tax=Loktanella atrilutea TaxID=366533 RepID=A0A1M4WAQ4_LOKAT|nr:YqaJ viral recombinase family protein [Loktanella atrilutea]SHE78042.1 Phage-related protein, predicted endonuclease [Loktanella atrilutea]